MWWVGDDICSFGLVQHVIEVKNDFLVVMHEILRKWSIGGKNNSICETDIPRKILFSHFTRYISEGGTLGPIIGPIAN